MHSRRRAVAAGLLVAVAAVLARGTSAGLTASNGVPASRARGAGPVGIGADALKPPECAGLTLTTIAGPGEASNGNDLVLGTAAGESALGGRGKDCVVGGGGDDMLFGGQGTDVCIGGPGNDTFQPDCETQIQ